MKKIVVLISLLSAALFGGCASSQELVRKNSVSTRSDVFVELADGGPVPQGYADLRITSSLKTHRSGIYSTRDIHGTPEYRLLINIDGQAALVQGTLKEEDIKPGSIRDPEAGEGVWYLFRKDLRLKAGTHRIVIALPEDKIAVEREITLVEGSSNMLELEPVYGAAPGKRRPGFYGVTSFMEGLRGIRAILNDKPM